MNLEELLGIFRTKIYLEYEVFKLGMLRKSAEEIYQEAYQIDTYITLYEILLEKSRKLAEDEITFLLKRPNVLAFLYDQWLKYEDSRVEDLEQFLKDEMSEPGKHMELEAA